MVYRLAGCELDGARFELRRNGEAVPVEPQVLELLLYLVVHRDRAVSRTELFEQLWRGRVVGDSALNSRIKAARAALGDDGASQEQIRTLHRTGYRYVGPVEELDDTPAALADPPAPPSPRRPPFPALRRRHAGVAAAVVCMALAAGALALLPRGNESAAVAVTAPLPAAPAEAAGRKTLAVLPFANLSRDEDQEYFADGIGVELLKQLSHWPELQVTGRTSSLYFEGRSEPPAAIGRELGVGHLLSGSVQKAGERVRITVELVDAASGYQLWTESYDRKLDDIFIVQDEIAARVATALQAKLGLGESSELGMTRNVAAYDAFLRGYAAYNERTPEAIQRAVEHMHRAIALDPSFSRAWAYLYCIYLDGGDLMPERDAEWYGKAVDALAHAHRLTPDSPFVRILHAREDMRYGRRLEARARLDAMPKGYWTADRYVTRDVFLGRFLITTGQAKEAIETLERARAADPLSPVVALYRATAHATAGNVHRALEVSDGGAELGSLQPLIAGNALLVSLATGDPQQIRHRAAARMDPITAALLPYLEDTAAGRAELHALASGSSPPDSLRSVIIAHWAAYFGDPELALREIEKVAHGALDEALLWRPILSDMRRLPGFKDLVRSEGLVEYWRVYGWPDKCQPTTADDFECS